MDNDYENNSNSNSNRGFNRMREYGVTAEDINIIRLLFHTAILSNQGKV